MCYIMKCKIAESTLSEFFRPLWCYYEVQNMNNGCVDFKPLFTNANKCEKANEMLNHPQTNGSGGCLSAN